MTKKLVIIDDDPDARLYYTTILEDMDFSFVEARDGVEGVKKVKKEKPDLILLDLMMPKKGGLQVLNEMKKDPNLRNIPVIIISGSSRETGVDMRRYFNKRSSHTINKRGTAKPTETTTEFLDKPVEPENLLKVVKRVLKLN